MSKELDGALRSSVSYAAFTASLAFALTAIAEDASAQQPQRVPNQGSGVQLDPVDVDAQQAGGDAQDSYTVRSAESSKQTAPLLNTPQTVTVIPHAIIQETGARTLTEVLRSTPGITFDAGENGFSTSTNNFKLRGFDTSGNVFIDGSRDNGSYTRDTFNVDRVEVFKGAAADNGRGSGGGYVNIVTKSPLLENFLAGDLSFGFDKHDSKHRKRATADINYMVTPNTAVRINGMWEDGGIAGREVVESNAWGFAPSIAFGLGTDKRAIFSYEHVSRRDLPDWGVPAHMIPGTKNFSTLGAGISRDNFYGLRSDFDDADSDAALARFEYDISKNTTISNQTRWSRIDRDARFTLPNAADVLANPMPTQTQYYGRINETLTNLTNLSSEFFTGALKHNLATGLELSRERSHGDRFGTTTPAAADIFNPNPDRSPGIALAPSGWSEVKIDTIAAYLYDTIQLSPQWQITGGARIEHYKVHIDSDTVTNFLNDSETTIGGKFGVVYKPGQDSSIYASVGLSYLPPGSYLSNSDISRGTDEQTFPGYVPGADPVRSINYEFGVKKDYFGGRLQTTAAVFRTEQRVPVAPGNVLFGYGDQIVQGVEFGFAGDITDRWKVFGGLLFLDSERKLSAAQDLALCQASPGDYGQPNAVACAASGVRANGDELSFTPDTSATLWTTYRFDNRWTLGGGLQYLSDSWVGRPDNANRVVKNGVNGKMPGYLVTHLMASYEIRKDVNLVLNVDNVFDKTYAANLNWSARKAQLGAPRTFRVSTNFRF